MPNSTEDEIPETIINAPHTAYQIINLIQIN